MSVENNKVCCNCRHCIRVKDSGWTRCICEINKHYMGYIQVMAGWCRHWATDAQKWKEKEDE